MFVREKKMPTGDVEIVFFVTCMNMKLLLDYLDVFQLPIFRVDFKLLLKLESYPLHLCGIAVVK